MRWFFRGLLHCFYDDWTYAAVDRHGRGFNLWCGEVDAFGYRLAEAFKVGHEARDRVSRRTCRHVFACLMAVSSPSVGAPDAADDAAASSYGERCARPLIRPDVKLELPWARPCR